MPHNQDVMEPLDESSDEEDKESSSSENEEEEQDPEEVVADEGRQKSNHVMGTLTEASSPSILTCMVLNCEVLP